MKIGNLVRLRNDMTHPLDLYETWSETGSILSEVGEMLPGQVAIILEMETDSHSRTGARVSIDGISGWIYSEFLETVE